MKKNVSTNKINYREYGRSFNEQSMSGAKELISRTPKPKKESEVKSNDK